MTGHKEGKGDRSSSQRSGGNGGGGGGGGSGIVAETGPLFPRLHVKETKTAGPRAPPRNKMALYEQFTFPSHRFVPPSLPLPPASGRPAATSTKATTYGPQRSSYEGSMFYGPSAIGGMPWMPYAAMNTVSHPGGQPSWNTGSHPGEQPSFNGSSSSTVVDCERELQQRPGVTATDTARPSSNPAGQGSLRTSCHSNVSSISSKKAQNNDDCMVPTYTPRSEHGPTFPSAGSDQFMWRAWQRHTQPAAVSSDYQVESSDLATLRTNRGAYSASGEVRDDLEASKEISRKLGGKHQGEEEQSDLQDCTDVQRENGPTQMPNNYAEHSDSHGESAQHRGHQQRQKKGSHAETITAAEALKSCATASGESVTVLESDREGGMHQRKIGLKARRAFECSETCESPATKSLEQGINRKGKRKGLLTGGQEMKKQANPSECKSSSSAGSHDEMEIASDTEVSEFSRTEAWSDAESDSSMSGPKSSRKPSKITNRDIVNAVGQQEFWRTRKLLQRQQKIFSAQVLELHRIIKVQQLLASSADLLMDEGISVGSGEKPEEVAELGEANPVQNADEEAEDAEALVGDQETPEVAMGKQPDSSCHSSTSYRMDVQPPVDNPLPDLYEARQVPSMLSSGPGLSGDAWVCPPFPKAGVNNWFGAMPAPNGGYMYQPYPGSFHPSQAHTMGAYNGAYRPLMCAPSPMDVPSITPYGMLRYEQRPDLMQDMYRYNSYPQQQWPHAMFCPPVASNPGAGWYGMPPPHMSYMDPALRGPYGWYDEMATGSHQSGPSNYLRPAHQNNAQTMPVPHPSFVMQSPWTDGLNSQQQMPWPASAETGRPSSPGSQRPTTYSSGQDCGQLGSPQVEGGVTTYGAPSFERPLLTAPGREDSEVSASQQAESGVNYGWGRAEGNTTEHHDHGSDEFSADKSNDKVLKRSRGSRGSGGVDGIRQNLVSSMPSHSQGNALPLFPLVPAVENGKFTNCYSPKVIKVVPRAMGATAESAAEILLSIQKQRQQ